jgi:hypothetical protein
MLILCVVCAACVKPALTAKEQTLTPFDRMFDADANQTYYAIRWALAATGYPVGTEDLQNGMIGTTWVPTKVGSQYLDPFDRQEQTSRDWGDNAGYYKMAFHVQPEEGKTRVTVTSHVKSVVANLKSSGEQEQQILNKVGDYLRGADPDVTNVGIAK